MPLSNPATASETRIWASLICMVGLLSAAPTVAHHSGSMYDSRRPVTVHGTVKSFEWVNPHIVLWVYVEQSGTAPQLWSLELSSPANVRPMGWTRRSLQPGDSVTIELDPLRDGTHGGWLRKVTTANGLVLVNKSIVGVVRPVLPQTPADARGR